MTKLRVLGLCAGLALGLLALHAWIGTPDGYSYIHNLPWFAAFENAFWSGNLLPRRLVDLWFGFGGLDFYFYAPMPFWIASLMGTASCPSCEPHTVFAIGAGWMVIFSAATFYALARHFFAPRLAGFGALLYAILPYHYVFDWYTRQAVGEVAAAIFLPLLILGVLRLQANRRHGLLMSLSFAGLIFSHLPTALLIVHFIALYVLIEAWQRHGPSTNLVLCLLPFAAWGGLGLALSAIYWIPAFILLSEVSAELLYTGYSQPVNWLFLDGRPEPNLDTSLIIKVMLSVAVLIGGLAYALLRHRIEDQSLRAWILAPIIFALALVSPISMPIWEYWILKSIQFPWRVMILVDIALALGLVAILRGTLHARRSGKLDAFHIAAPTLALIGLIASYVICLPQAIGDAEDGQQLQGDYLVTGAPEYIPAHTMAPVREVFRSRTDEINSGFSSHDLIFEIIADIRAQALANFEADIVNGTLIDKTGHRIEVSLTLEEAGAVRLPIPYWRFWTAHTKDGTPLSLIPDPNLGMMSVSLPAGENEIVLELPRTTPELIGLLISFAALLILFTLLWARRPIPLARLWQAMAAKPKF